MSEEKSIAERLAGLERCQENIQLAMEDMKKSMSKMADVLSKYMTDSADFRARLLAIEQDLRDGRERFKEHSAAIAAIQLTCSENKSLREAGKKHLDEAKDQEVRIHGAWLTAGWAERSVWLLITGVLGILLYLATRGAAGGP